MAMTNRKTLIFFLALVGLLGEGLGVKQMSITKAAPMTNAAKPLVVDNFEDGDMTTRFGTIWRTYTDAGLGGKSTAEARIVDSGATGTKKALRLMGRVTTDFQFGFAGIAMGLNREGRGQVMTRFTGIRFYARGDGDVYQAQVLCAAVKDHNEFGKEFVAPKEWTLITVPFSQLVQSPFWGQPVQWTGKDVRGIAFQTVGAPRHAYVLEVDEISFY